jgi:hypothetical protein
VVDKLIATLRERHINALRDGSGMVMRQIAVVNLHMALYEPLAGHRYAELPKFLAKKQAIVNVRNQDSRCFGYAILAAKLNLNHHDHPDRPTKYDGRFREFGLDQLTYPVQIDKLEEVERQLGIAFNVFSFKDDEGKWRYPLYLSRLNVDKAIDLLYWKTHFAWIKSFSSFMSDITKSHRQLYWCKRCLCHFQVEPTFTEHQQWCRGMEGCKPIYKMPNAEKKVEYKEVKYEERLPFVIYADFESLLVPIEKREEASNGQDATPPKVQKRDVNDNEHGKLPITATNNRRSKRNFQHEHKAISVGLKLVSSVPGVLGNLPYESYTGPEPAEWLLERLINYEKQCVAFLYDTKKINITPMEEAAFAAARECYICNKSFKETGTKKGDAKVRDHDHISGDYRGAAHSRCNLLKRRQRKIPVFFHNLRGYDEHLLIPALGKHKERHLKIIGQTMEKYMLIEFGHHLVFKDTLQFLACKLETLVSNLVASDREKFVELKRGFNDANIDLLLRKGIYPYEYMTSADHFKETQLPPIEAFDSMLYNEKCDPKDYEHAQRVWEAFGCTTLLDYHNIYLKCDVLHLADIFEHFRAVSLKEYSLDPAHFVSAPMLTWNAMMRTTKCKLDLLTDAEMFATIQNNLRGGISMISKRYAKANVSSRIQQNA